MNISDEITATLVNMLEGSGIARFRRNELAQSLGCVPSQITYVVSSRFTPEKGYIVESRRGGDGCIQISRIQCTKSEALMHVVNGIGDDIDESSARSMIKAMLDGEMIGSTEASIMNAAVNENCYRALEKKDRNKTRAEIFKRMIISCIREA